MTIIGATLTIFPEIVWYKLDENKNAVQLDKGIAPNPNAFVKDKIVKREIIKLGNKSYLVSTVFLGFDLSLGIDEKPILFETGVFPEKKGVEIHRQQCTTYQEALKNHVEIVDALRNGKLDERD